MSERFSDEVLEKARDAFNVLFDQQYGELPTVEDVYRAAYAAMRAVLERPCDSADCQLSGPHTLTEVCYPARRHVHAECPFCLCEPS